MLQWEDFGQEEAQMFYVMFTIILPGVLVHLVVLLQLLIWKMVAFMMIYTHIQILKLLYIRTLVSMSTFSAV